MSTFDAIGHAMAAIATGGFSSHDAGIGYFKSPAIEWIATLFMLLAAMPFALHVQAVRGNLRPLFTESQVRLFVLVVAAGIVLLALWRLDTGAATLEQAWREASFNVVSTISTTGFTSHDFGLWGGFPALLLLCAMLMGGCTGSTAGGIKMFRLFVLLEALKAQIRRQMFPNGVFGLHYNRQPIAPAIVTAVVTYAFAYLMTFSLWRWPVADRPDLRGEPGCVGDLVERGRAWPRPADRPLLHVRRHFRCRQVAAHLRHAGRSAGDPAADPAVHAGVLACLSGG